jgi:hypothetical protein
MTDDDNRTNQMFVKVREFSTRHSADFSPTSVTHQLFTDLAAEIENIDTQATKQTASAAHAEHLTELKANARDVLRADLEAIYRAARAMGIETDFPVPPNNDHALLRSAGAFAATAAPLSAQFITHELPATFLADLTADANAFEVAMTAQENARSARIIATAELREAIGRAEEIVRELKDLIPIKYANDPVVWRNGPAPATLNAPPNAPPPAASPASPGSGGPPPPA